MRVTLNITLKCNLHCHQCNRGCDVIDYGDEWDMTYEQVKKFVYEAKGRRVRIVKIAGGEPLLHPRFLHLFNLLARANRRGYIGQVRLGTNGIIPLPLRQMRRCHYRIMESKPNAKCHYPFRIAPVDIGETWPPNKHCEFRRMCGYSLDAKGYLPCSCSIPIVKAFGLNHLYQDKLPCGPWGLDEICRYCGMLNSKRVLRGVAAAKGLHEYRRLKNSESWEKALGIERGCEDGDKTNEEKCVSGCGDGGRACAEPSDDSRGV